MSSNYVYAICLALFAGISTGIGGLFTTLLKKTRAAVLSSALGFSAGIMIYVSFIEIYRESEATLCSIHGTTNGKILTVLVFFFGITLMAFIDRFIPEPDTKQDYTNNIKRGKLLKTGIFTAIAVTIHNFPEGIATFISSVKSPTLGLSVALAIAIHNIPEGIAISVPFYYATKKKWKAFLISLASGLSEPLGAITAMLVLGPNISDNLFGIIFGMVAGIMVYISLNELLPSAREYGRENLSILGFMLGMAVMAISTIFIF